MRDPELVARAGYAAARLEQAWERWRVLHGLGGSADPLASYVGYSLKEPMGQPRVVIGLDAAEAEFFADFLESHDCAASAPDPAPAAGISPAPPAGPRPLNDVGHLPVNGGVAHPSDSGALYPPISGPQRVMVNGSSRRAPAGTERPVSGPQASAAPVARALAAPVRTFAPTEEIEAVRPAGPAGHPAHAGHRGAPDPAVASPEPPDVMAAELAGWASGELPGQASEQLASWAAADAADARGLDRALDRSRSAR
jgi:hypothetical protein